MLDDAKNGHINMVVTKSISRFGRDAPETISSISELKEFGVDVYFHSENVHSTDINNILLLTISSAVAETGKPRSRYSSWATCIRTRRYFQALSA